MAKPALSGAGATATADHICLKQPCYYCMVRAHKPLPADILTGPPPRPSRPAIVRTDLSRIHPETRSLVCQLLEQLGAPARRHDGDADGLYADFSLLRASTRASVGRLLDQLADGEPARLGCVRSPGEASELAARVVMDRRGVILSCEPEREEYLVRPADEQVGAHVREILRPPEARTAMENVTRLFTTGAVAPRRLHMVMMTGRMAWVEKRLMLSGNLAVLEIFHLRSVLDDIPSLF